MNVFGRLLALVSIPRMSAASIETGPIALIQLKHQTTGAIQDAVPHVQLYGFASVPVLGCDHVTLSAEGDRSKTVSVASNDQRYRPKSMAAGESQQHDNAGQQVYLKAGTTIIVNGVNEIDFQINGTLVGKFTAAGLAVTGAITATGEITAMAGSAASVTVSRHAHKVEGVQAGSATLPTDPPTGGT